MWCPRNGNVSQMNVSLSGEILENVYSFKYLGSYVVANREIERNVIKTIKEGYKEKLRLNLFAEEERNRPMQKDVHMMEYLHQQCCIRRNMGHEVS